MGKTNLALVGLGLVVGAALWDVFTNFDRTQRVTQRAVAKVQAVAAPVFERVAPILERTRVKDWAFPFHARRKIP